MKPKLRFIRETFARSLLFLLVMMLLHRHPIFKTLAQEKKTLVKKGTTTQQLKQAGIGAAKTVNAASASIFKSISELLRGDKVKVSKEDEQRLHEMEERLATIMAGFNEGVGRILNTTANETKTMISPLMKEINIITLLQLPSAGTKKTTDLILTGGHEMRLYSTSADVGRIQGYVKSKKEELSNALEVKDGVHKTIMVILDDETKKRAAGGEVIGEVAMALINEMQKISTEMNTMQANKVHTVEQISQQQYLRGSATKQTPQEKLIIYKTMEKILSYFHVSTETAAQYMADLFEDLNKIKTKGKIILHDQVYMYVRDLLPDTFNQNIHMDEAKKKIAELLSSVRNSGDFFEKSYFHGLNWTKRKLMDTATGLVVSVYSDTIWYVINLLLIVLYKPVRAIRTTRRTKAMK